MGLLQYALTYIFPHFPALRLLTVVIPLLLQAALLYPRQTPSTLLARAALIPLGLYFSTFIILDPSCDFQPRDAYRAINFIKNVSFTLLFIRTLEFGLVRDKYEWIGYGAALAGEKQSSSRTARPDQLRTSLQHDAWPIAMFKHALMTMLTSRGIGWNWGIKGKLIPPPFERATYYAASLKTFIRAHFILIASISLCQPYIRNTDKDFLATFGITGLPFQAQVSQLLLGITFGFAVWNFLEMTYILNGPVVKLATQVLRSATWLPSTFTPEPFDERAWPPLLQNPVVSDSLSDFWTYRWHSVLRRTFLLMGYRPLQWLTGSMGPQVSALCGVMGAFLASGMLHEIALYFATVEMPVDRTWPTMRFFALQGLGVILEQIFKRATGRRVSGLLGRIWLFAMTAYPGGALCQAWLGRGLLTHIPSPDTWEWWRWLPYLSYVPRTPTSAPSHIP